jgi:hypothetical protein
MVNPDDSIKRSILVPKRRIMIIGVLLLGLLFVVLGKDRLLNITETDVSSNNEDLLTIAAEAVREYFPHSIDALNFEPIIEEDDTLWIIQYQLPQYILGGTPIIYIDKKTNTVVKVEHSQ